MKTFYAPFKIVVILIAVFLLSSSNRLTACTPQGDQTTYGSNGVWIGYVYQEKSFNVYKGYVNEGVTANPNFDESFGGSQVSYNTNGCPVYTDTFSVRYKLTQTFANGNYLFTVGGDDGFRLSLDGGATWVINQWNDQSYNTTTYTVALNGTYNMVLEYYEDFGSNRISFNVAQICMGTGDPTVYGANGVWNGYLYQGMSFNMYKGQVTEGSSGDPNFDESFGNPGGSNSATYNTSSCSVTTYQFSARYRLTQVLSAATYVITVGGDDGYRLSLDGGSTWVINKWNDQSYIITTYTANLSGTYNMVLEYYDNGGNDRISFSMSSTPLPVSLVTWSVSSLSADQSQLQWQATDAINFDHFVVQRSTDGESFADIHTTPAATGGTVQNYSYTDQYSYTGMLYYRLVMVDQNGAISYSTVISIQRSATGGIGIFPTVVENGSFFVESPHPVSNARLEVFDMNGRKIDEKDWALLEGRQQVSLSAGHYGGLSAGCYIARLSDGHSILAKQILLIK